MEKMNLYPWIIRVDKEKSIEYYLGNDLSENKVLNKDWVKILDESTRKFFESFGVDMDKVCVEFIPAFPSVEEGVFFSRDCYKIEFVFAGYFEAIPSSQWEFYFGFVDDEPPIFDVDEDTPEIVEVDDHGIVVHSSEDKMEIGRAHV